MEKKRLYTAAIILEAVLMGLCIIKVLPDIFSRSNQSAADRKVETAIHEHAPAELIGESQDAFTREAWLALKEQNDDFAGYLEWEAGIVKTPVVQAQNDEQYLSTAFDGSYSSMGTPFLDPYCSNDSENRTIYGHNVYYDDSAVFSPLSKLVNQQFFYNHSTFTFYEKDCIRHYRVCAVYYADPQDADKYDYSRANFADIRDKQNYIDMLRSVNQIYTDDPLTVDDRMMTLQTCRRWSDQHVVIVAKEISTEPYEN